MSRTKSVFDEYPQNKRYPAQNQQVKYVPVDSKSRKLNPYGVPSRRVSHRLRTERKPSLKTYYIPVAANHELAGETDYKHAGVSDHYMYRKPYSNYFLHEPLPKTTPKDNQSVVYLKYPKPILEEKVSSYYERVDGESGDYIREQDYYEYDTQNIEYYEPERKMEYDNLLLNNDEIYYGDYLSETSAKKRNIKKKKNSDYYSKYTTVISQTEQKNKYIYNDNSGINKKLIKETPQKIKTKVEYSQPFLEPVKQDPSISEKIVYKKNDDDSEASTIYDREFNLQFQIEPAYNTVSSQTTELGNLGNKSPKFQIKDCFNKSTQTLQLDFTEHKVNLCNTGTQTMVGEKTSDNNSSKGTETVCAEDIKSKLTESIGSTNISVFSLDYVQLSKSRTNSFLCPKVSGNHQRKSPKKVEPFIFTATLPPNRSRKKLPAQKKL